MKQMKLYQLNVQWCGAKESTCEVTISGVFLLESQRSNKQIEKRASRALML